MFFFYLKKNKHLKELERESENVIEKCILNVLLFYFYIVLSRYPGGGIGGEEKEEKSAYS
jgi:hypothetical protein